MDMDSVFSNTKKNLTFVDQEAVMKSFDFKSN